MTDYLSRQKKGKGGVLSVIISIPLPLSTSGFRCPPCNEFLLDRNVRVPDCTRFGGASPPPRGVVSLFLMHEPLISLENSP